MFQFSGIVICLTFRSEKILRFSRFKKTAHALPQAMRVLVLRDKSVFANTFVPQTPFGHIRTTLNRKTLKFKKHY